MTITVSKFIFFSNRLYIIALDLFYLLLYIHVLDILYIAQYLWQWNSSFYYQNAVRDKKLGYSGVMFVSLFFAVLFYLPIFLYSFTFHPHLFSNTIGLLFLCCSILVTTSAFLIYVHALAVNDLSVFGPLDTLRPFFVILFSTFLLGQLPTSLLFLGVFFITAGAIILTFRKQFFTQVRHLKNTSFILLSTAIFGLGAVVDKKTLLYMNPFQYVFFILAGVCSAYGILHLKKHKRIYFSHFFSPSLLLSGFLWALGYIGIMLAVKIATPNQVSPLQMTRSLYLSLLGFVFLNEKGYVKKCIAAALMLIGVFLITR